MTDDAIKKLANLDLKDPNAAAIMAKICVPHAEANGAQEGRPSPARMKYPSSKGKKPISSDEAIKRYREKLKSGGPVYPVEQPDVQLGETAPDDLDPFTTAEPVVEKKAVEDPEPETKRTRRSRSESRTTSDRLLELLLDRIAPLEASKAISARQTPEAREGNTSNTHASNPLDEFKKLKEVVRIKLATGLITMPCLYVQQENFSITVFMDANANGFVFVPEEGMEVALSWGNQPPVKAYFPGAQFTLPKLGISGMVFLSDPEERPLPKKPQEPAPVKKAPSEPPQQPPVFKFNPETGLEEDEFGLTKV